MLAAVVVVAAVAVAAPSVLRHAESATDVLEGPVDRVVVEVDDGQVEVVGTAEPGVVRIVRSRRALVASVPATTQRLSRNVLRVIGICPGGLVLRCRTDFRLEVPADVLVDVTTVQADVAVDAMAGTVEVTSRSGRVAVNRLGGKVLVVRTERGAVAGTDVAATDVNIEARGSVALGLTNPVDRLSVRSSKGALDVTVPDAPYRVVTDSAIGQVEVELTVDGGSRRSVELIAPEGDIRARTAG